MVTSILADIGAIGTALGVGCAAVQLVRNGQQARAEFEDHLTEVYRGLVAELPVEAFLDAPVPNDLVNKHLGVFYRYFDLCNEQAFLHRSGRISDRTWIEWDEGILKNLARPAFAKAWGDEIKPLIGNDFSDLRRVLDEHAVALRVRPSTG